MSTRALERPVLLLAALMAGLMAACGERAADDSQESWPLTVPQTGVLGYLAVDLPASERDALLQALLGWVPAGLADGRPLVALQLDSATFGGPVAVIVPLADGGAFDESLRASSHVQTTGDDRYRIRLPADGALGMLVFLARAAQATSPTDVLGALHGGLQLEFPIEIERQDDVAFAVPSFEALSSCRSVQARFAGPPPAEVVLSLDLERVQTVYAEDIRQARQQLHALISGARTGSPLFMGMAGEDDGGLDLPVPWELLWAVLEMFEARQFAAAQIALGLDPDSSTAPPVEGATEVDPADVLDDIERIALRVRLLDGSRLRAIVDSLRPAPALEGAWLELGAEPDAFARAFAEWMRPVAAVVKGEGPPCDRYVEELAALLGAWDGRLALRPDDEGEPLLLVGARDSDVTLERWLAWLQPLLATARVESWPDDARPERLEDGTLVVRHPDTGEIVARAKLDQGVFWVSPGDRASPPPALLAAFRAAGGSTSDPAAAALRAVVGEHRVQAASSEGELRLQIAVGGRDR